MTSIIVPVWAETIEQLRQRVKRAAELGAGAVELRLDLMPQVADDEIRSLREPNDVRVPLVLTLRDVREGGDWDGPDEDKLARIEALSAYVDFIDVEYAFWSTSDEIRRRVVAALSRVEQLRDGGAPDDATGGGRRRLILSRHNLSDRPSTLQADLLAMAEIRECDIIKLAWRARTVRDNFEAFELLRSLSKPSIMLCMGEDGLLSRILARKFEAFATYAALEPGLESAPGQVTIGELRGRYAWDRIQPWTKLYGVIGDPVAHSLSPAVHNAVFAQEALDATFLPVHVGPGYESFKAFMAEVAARDWLHFMGFSVTLPHKEHALCYVRETGGPVSDAARRVGAANTLYRLENGEWGCTNTDLPAVVESLVALTGGADALKGSRALVLGAGGMARAAVAGLVDLGCGVLIANRTRERALALASDFGAGMVEWPPTVPHDVTLVVNCTSVGLWPDAQDCPIDPSQLRPGLAVFDTLYRPEQTRLLREATRRGGQVLGGLRMFARQAGLQFEHWTGRRIPADFLENQARFALLEG